MKIYDTLTVNLPSWRRQQLFWRKVVRDTPTVTARENLRRFDTLVEKALDQPRIPGGIQNV